MLELFQDIGHKLRVHGFKASGVQITVGDNNLSFKQFQGKLMRPTARKEIDEKGRALFIANYGCSYTSRAITGIAINLQAAERCFSD